MKRLPTAQGQKNPETAERNSSSNRNPGNGPIVDYTIRTTALDEIEHLTKTLISPTNKLAPLTRGASLDAKLQFHGLSSFCVFKIFFGSPLSCNLGYESADDRIAFVMPSKGAGQLLWKRKEFTISKRHGAVFTSGPPATLNYLDDCETSVLVLNRQKIAEHCAKLLGRDLDGDVEFDTQFDPDNANGQHWARLFQYAFGELSNPESLVRHMPAAYQQLEQMVINASLLAHTHSYTTALLEPQNAAVPYYVKRAEAYIEAYFADSISLADIAAHVGVSARSLQSGFQNYRNTTPMAFLRSIRLQRAHNALREADPAATTVTEIALSNGFCHMGEFSAAYRRAYGISPSESLWRSSSPANIRRQPHQASLKSVNP